MCIRVRRAPSVTNPWDGHNTITIPAALDAARALIAIRAVLRELGVLQPEFGAVCWCGAPVTDEVRIPLQRRTPEVMAHGT
ncbi:hypothetical protein [Streptomyces sulphureus]|uniref:hypothetical protein n=1 Tax=Streptomyces sulphureus TaxID=47758 RepID=UPI0003A28E43|nr:hypothetical protein [Streptomyces sulphureus]